ncbi:hypothetical protein V6N13_122726 [Hibiscus sabdariffa]
MLHASLNQVGGLELYIGSRLSGRAIEMKSEKGAASSRHRRNLALTMAEFEFKSEFETPMTTCCEDLLLLLQWFKKMDSNP